MNIKKEFIPLILSGEKEYEFRNSDDKEGIYEINGNFYLLKREWLKNSLTFSLVSNWYAGRPGEFQFCGCMITEEEYEWIINNREYFTDNKVWVYKWIKMLANKVEKLEGV